jgi:hypothetical protein
LHTIDFTTALARLLRDGAWRDSFRENPSETADALHVRVADRAAFVSLSPNELEAQADTLLRKRIDQVKQFAPELCAGLGERLWPQFREYARRHWPEKASDDALRFCEKISATDPRVVSKAEINRLRFTASNRCICLCRIGAFKIQILFRNKNGGVRELRLSLRV